MIEYRIWAAGFAIDGMEKQDLAAAATQRAPRWRQCPCPGEMAREGESSEGPDRRGRGAGDEVLERSGPQTLQRLESGKVRAECGRAVVCGG